MEDSSRTIPPNRIRRPRAAASLKLVPVVSVAALENGIRRPRAAASLKPTARHQTPPIARKYPPPSGGGLIEAYDANALSAGQYAYPPPSGGGLIEASLDSVRPAERLASIRRPRAAASLKLRLARGGQRRRGRIRRPRAAASLKPRRQHAPLRGSRPYPPPSGGGLIEAGIPESSGSTTPWVSAALGRRPH